MSAEKNSQGTSPAYYRFPGVLTPDEEAEHMELLTANKPEDWLTVYYKSTLGLWTSPEDAFDPDEEYFTETRLDYIQRDLEEAMSVHKDAELFAQGLKASGRTDYEVTDSKIRCTYACYDDVVVLVWPFLAEEYDQEEAFRLAESREATKNDSLWCLSRALVICEEQAVTSLRKGVGDYAVAGKYPYLGEEKAVAKANRSLWGSVRKAVNDMEDMMACLNDALVSAGFEPMELRVRQPILYK